MISQRFMVAASLLADEQRESHDDAPARAKQCTCGHLAGDHRSAGSSWPHPPRLGVCLITGCECRGFQPPRTIPGTTRSA
ncbi:MAG TPA: hypothetical protein VK631_08695 [Solirubrobacteraceae bacterium]|nr:hypothetical protein [Solirubrobacteraceae bacterium]